MNNVRKEGLVSYSLVSLCSWCFNAQAETYEGSSEAQLCETTLVEMQLPLTRWLHYGSEEFEDSCMEGKANDSTHTSVK